MEDKKTKSGYMTVEATLVMPIVLYICIFIIYAGFFQYDRCVLKQDAYRAALQGRSTYRESNEEVYRAAHTAMENMAENKYIACERKYEISVKGKVNVVVRGEVSVPFAGLRILVGSSWNIEERAESTCLNPVFFIRTCRQIGIK